MRAVVFETFGGPLDLREVAEPRCPANGVVVQVGATGVCRSDWHGWQGHDDGIVLPHVPGHELAGTVVEVGAGVTSWQGGEVVTVPFVCACGRCRACLAGQQQVCEQQTQPGFTHWGSFAELVAIENADVNLVRLPPGMTAVTAASLGCRFATAYRALTVHGRVGAGVPGVGGAADRLRGAGPGVSPQEWVAVHGCGGVGLSVVMIAVALGARVVAVDVAGPARQAALDLGAEVVLDPAALAGDDGTWAGSPAGHVPRAGDAGIAVDGSGTDVALARRVAERVVEATGGGAHVSVDALGHPQTAASSVLGLRRRGRHVQVGLLLADEAWTSLPMDRVLAWELEIYGSHGMAAHEYPAMLEHVASGALRPDLLVGRTVPLEDAAGALAAMGTPRSVRPAGMTVVVP